MSVIGSNILAGASGQAGYNLTNSLRFRSSASAYLNRTFGTPTSTTTWSLSFWLKRGNLTANAQVFSAGGDFIYFGGGTFAIKAVSGAVLETTQVFRDPSAWYHFLVVADTSNATANNRVRLYVNGTEVTAFSSRTNPSLSAATIFNASSSNNRIGGTGSTEFYDGYLAEINFIDGQALTPSSFGETSTSTGVWIPKKYTGTYGTNGFYLPFTDTTSTSTLGTDFSGNSNTWTVNNISLTAGSTYDSMTDVPTLTSATTANYAVMNPLRPFGGSLSNGNLTAVTGNSGSANSGFVTSTVWLPTSGKFYFEATPTTVSDIAIGLTTDSNIRAAMYYRSGDIYINGSVTTSQASYTNNDVIGVAVDIGGATVQFYKNNAAQGTAQSISAITAPLVASLAQLSGSSSATAEVNFGQQPFSYTPPTGFVALNTFNLPTPTIGYSAAELANEYFDATLYTGNGSAATDVQTITNSGSFQPDLVWTKSRSNAVSHHIGDSVRGIDKTLFSNSTSAEGTYTYDIHAFNSNGFTVGNDGTQNTSGYTYVAWQWRASNATAVTNTAGTITSTVSASTTAGFSIVTYTGTGGTGTVGHGLGVTPSMIIVKGRSTAGDPWAVYHSSLANTQFLYLNTTAAVATGVNLWNSTTPTSSVFSVGATQDTNRSAGTLVAYCFAQIAGYSAFGSYTGNGSTDGTFVFTGFRPRFVMFKGSSIASNWCMLDSARNTYNLTDATLQANDSAAELTNLSDVDFLSNGIKIRDVVTNDTNVSGQTYIYMAFAESPFKYANAR